MRTLKLADAVSSQPQRSTLGNSLIQITQGTDQPRKSQQSPESVDGYAEFQEQWRSNSRLISQRLSLIEEELNRISRDDIASPQLNLFQAAEAVS
ncbi:MAG: hypothetical protein ACYTGL_14605 [Planctomycetota bacterium]|jgi:hypothetical protein